MKKITHLTGGWIEDGKVYLVVKAGKKEYTVCVGEVI